MARSLTASDRRALIRLASTMPKGSPERRAILAYFRIPKVVEDFAKVIRKHLEDLGVQDVTVEPFNSGVVGIVIDSPRFGKYLYRDQPGVVGLEDQRQGYMSFGKYPESRGMHYRHRGRSFGDVNLSDRERRDFQKRVLNRIAELAQGRTASRNVVASSPTALAKVVRSTPGLESLSDRDSMAVAKGLIRFLLKKLKWLLDDELDDAFDLAESDYEEGEYEAVVYSGGGPSRFGPDWDEDYYDITEERSFEYAAKVRAPFNLWFRLDDALAEINGISPLAQEEVDGNAKALFGALARSRLMESIVKDAIKNQWRTWFKKEVAEYAAEEAESETSEYLDSSLRVKQELPYNLGYNLKTVTLGSDSKIHIELDVFAAFNEPEIGRR